MAMDNLTDLEQQVHAACDQLRTLRKQNRSLKAKVKKLEADAESAASDGEWAAERAEVHSRVAKLTETLEGLL